MESMPTLFPPYDMIMTNPYLPRIHGSQMPDAGRMKQKQTLHQSSYHPQLSHPHKPEYQRRFSEVEMPPEMQSRHHHPDHTQFFGYAADYDPHQHPGHRESNRRKRQDKSLERDSSDSKKVKKAKSVKKKSKSFDESMGPVPVLTLPRVELWCRDPNCLYNKHSNHSHCNTSSNHSSHGRNSTATTSSKGNSSSEKGFPGKISRSRLSSNTVLTNLSGSSSTAVPLSSGTTTTSLTMQSNSSGNSNSDGDVDGQELGRSFFGFGGRLKAVTKHQQIQERSRRNSSQFEGPSSRNFLHAYTQYPPPPSNLNEHGHGNGPSSFDSGMQSSGGNAVAIEENSSGTGIGIGPGAIRSSRAATIFVNSLAAQALEGQCQFSSPPSAPARSMSMPRGPHYAKAPSQNQLQQNCSRYGCRHQCQQQNHHNQLPMALPSPGMDGNEGNKMDAMNTFWHLNNIGGFQSTLKRDASFHSCGGFTLNGQPGYNTLPKSRWGRFCSSHKIALVVSGFSFIVTIGLAITLLLMKNKGMMEPM